MPRHTPRYLLLLVLLVFSVFMLVVQRPIQIFQITSNSMFPTLAKGDLVLGYSIPFWKLSVTKGDVVAFDQNGQTDDVDYLVKRVVATSGDLVSTYGDYAAINSIPRISSNGVGDQLKVTHIDGEEIFVMGDNRSKSVDSRAFGPVKIHNVKFKVVGRLFSGAGRVFSPVR